VTEPLGAAAVGAVPARGDDAAAETRAVPFASLEERCLLARHREHGDAGAREELVRRYLPLARRLASRFRYTGEPGDDLRQVASLALVKAIDRYEPDRGTTLYSYAVPTILGELKHHLRHTWSLHVPRAAQERAMEVTRASHALSTRLGRFPRPAEVAEATGLTVEEILEALEAAEAHDALSLDVPRGDGDEDGVATYADNVGAADPSYDRVEYGATIAPAFAALPERERLVIHLRFAEDLTQTEIAQRIGVSQMHVSRLIRRAIARMSEEVNRDGVSPA
jgi:RNA polymerase sigma-B factor